jgi:predicted DNA-binding transcriptional regulator YafY
MPYSPATRLLTLMEVLQARGSVGAAELAARLEVEARSVRRYIVMLQDLGMPIEARRGRYGGYRLRPGYKLPPLMFTDDEALAVTLGLLTTRRLGFLGLADAAPAVEGALAKIERVLPLGLRERAQAVQTMVAINPASLTAPSWDGAPPDPDVLSVRVAAERVLTFSAAARQGRRLWLRYSAGDGATTERDFDCYGLVYHERRWYAIGYCHLRAALRAFRLDRVVAATPHTDPAATFTRPVGFDCLAYAVTSFATWPDTWLVEALIAAPLAEVYRATPPAFATLEETPDGVLLRAYVGDLDDAAHLLVGLNLPFRVRQPPELLDALRRLADEISAIVTQSQQVERAHG